MEFYINFIKLKENCEEILIKILKNLRRNIEGILRVSEKRRENFR